MLICTLIFTIIFIQFFTFFCFYYFYWISFLYSYSSSYGINIQSHYNFHAGIEGAVLYDIDPSKGSFADTPALPKGLQLKALHTKFRSLFNGLMSRVNASGSHSVGEDLILCAYERCGLENRPKDMALLFYYMTVRDRDLAFLTSTLFPEESASEFSENYGDEEIKSETKYGKKQRLMKVTAEMHQSAAEVKQVSLIKACLNPASEVSEEMNSSIIFKNNMQGEESRASKLLLNASCELESAKKLQIEINIVLSILSNEVVFARLAPEKQASINEQLTNLLDRQFASNT